MHQSVMFAAASRASRNNFALRLNMFFRETIETEFVLFYLLNSLVDCQIRQLCTRLCAMILIADVATVRRLLLLRRIPQRLAVRWRCCGVDVGVTTLLLMLRLLLLLLIRRDC